MSTKTSDSCFFFSDRTVTRSLLLSLICPKVQHVVQRWPPWILDVLFILLPAWKWAYITDVHNTTWSLRQILICALYRQLLWKTHTSQNKIILSEKPMWSNRHQIPTDPSRNQPIKQYTRLWASASAVYFVFF